MAKCQVGVVGTGVMSTGTATLLICNRYPTVMYGRTQESCERGLRAVGEALDDLISAGAMAEGAERNRSVLPYDDHVLCGFGGLRLLH